MYYAAVLKIGRNVGLARLSVCLSRLYGLLTRKRNSADEREIGVNISRGKKNGVKSSKSQNSGGRPHSNVGIRPASFSLAKLRVTYAQV